VFFRAFRGQEKRNLHVREIGKGATRSLPIILHRNIQRNDVLVHLCTNTDNIRQKLFFAANERESTQIGRNRFGIIDASWIHLRVFALICGKRFLSRIKLNTARSMLPEIESTCTRNKSDILDIRRLCGCPQIVSFPAERKHPASSASLQFKVLRRQPVAGS